GCIANVCGDDVAGGPGEQCDDGNTNEMDGCSTTCQLTGTVAVNLTWELPVDLDLYLELPDGTTIAYFNLSAQGGSLDADDVCETVLTTDGDETITFPTNAPVGTYRVFVDLYSSCSLTLEEGVELSFMATVNGEIVAQGGGAVPPDATQPIELATFVVP